MSERSIFLMVIAYEGNVISPDPLTTFGLCLLVFLQLLHHPCALNDRKIVGKLKRIIPKNRSGVLVSYDFVKVLLNDADPVRNNKFLRHERYKFMAYFLQADPLIGCGLPVFLYEL